MDIIENTLKVILIIDKKLQIDLIFIINLNYTYRSISV